MLLSDFQVSRDGLLVVSVVLPVLGRGEDLMTALLGHSGATGEVLVDGVHQVRSVLVGNSESLTVHSGLLIHVDGFLWLLCVDKALLGFGKVTTLELELGLI